jgi:predicted enzyme related to lactoylglutathione lyase
MVVDSHAPGDFCWVELETSDQAAYEGQQGQAPPHWNAYVATASADETAEKIKQLGGNLVHGPFDVYDVGRMCIMQDPTGAFLCAWQAKSHIGVRRQDEPNALCWVELSTTDTEAAEAYYTSLFGWNAKGDEQYTEWQNNGRSIGGMMAMPQEVQAMGIPSYWMPYFQVASCEDSFGKAKSLGAQPIVPPHTIEHVGTFSLLRDPQSAVFAIIQLKRA